MRWEPEACAAARRSCPSACKMRAGAPGGVARAAVLGRRVHAAAGRRGGRRRRRAGGALTLLVGGALIPVKGRQGRSDRRGRSDPRGAACRLQSTPPNDEHAASCRFSAHKACGTREGGERKRKKGLGRGEGKHCASKHTGVSLQGGVSRHASTCALPNEPSGEGQGRNAVTVWRAGPGRLLNASTGLSPLGCSSRHVEVGQAAPRCQRPPAPPASTNPHKVDAPAASNRRHPAHTPLLCTPPRANGSDNASGRPVGEGHGARMNVHVPCVALPGGLQTTAFRSSVAPA